jgi:hypothetical protein
MKRYTVFFLLFLSLCGAALFSIVGSATGSAAHSSLTWQGPQTCLACHETQARNVHASSHYQWQGSALYTVNGADTQGKLITAVNSYCIAVLGNWNACGSCHVGLGVKPDPSPTTAQLQNIDCLMCHQKDYKRVKVNGVFVPDTANMTITMDQAVQTVHRPVRANCLQCHAKGGGGDNNKRGDMALAHGTTADRNFDVHMSSTGANLTCQQCHTTQNHRIAGRGSDLRQTDLDVKISCSTATCHPNKATATGHATADVNRHINRVACQTCHIPTFARNAADTPATETTEVYRNWQVPEWNATLNRNEPAMTRGGDIKPAYRFWNGTSWNYSLKDPLWQDTQTGAYATSRPEGAIYDPASKLFPFKYKKALQPIADSLNMMIALDTSVYFSTGNYDAAVKSGLVNMGYRNTTPYRTVETDTYQLITHEIMPKGNALTCAQCHTASATQMNLKGMGYTMKGTQATTCTQCHGQENLPSYTSLHNNHVSSKGYDCSWCHSFSRPEKGLRKPSSGIDTTVPIITAFTVPSTSNNQNVPVSVFTATDNVAVTEYLITESPAKPSATSVGWTAIKPDNYVFSSGGQKTLYAWAKDGSGNISSSLAATIVVSGPAAASTGSADNITSNSVTLNGILNPNGLNTSYYFEWGLTSSYGNVTSSQAAGSGTTDMTVTANLPGLTANTTYHYRLVVSSSSGVSNGSDGSFTTLGGPPGAATLITPWGNTALSSPTFSWHAVSGATQYNLSVNDSSGTKINQSYTASQAGCPSGTGICSVPSSVVLSLGAGTWQVQTQNSYGLGPWSSGSPFTIVSGAPKVDFNADLKPDLLWQNKVTGDVAVWQMNGMNFTAGQTIYSGLDLNWEIAGTGDFNNDGKTDILFRNKASGDLAVWLMSGTDIFSGQIIYSGMDLSWQVAGTGDFNSDGKTDILWRHKVSGDVAVWLMNGTAIAEGQIIYSGMNLNWQVAGTGDFNSDGRTDILWRHKVSGDVAVWLMNGTAIAEGQIIYSGMNLNWQVAGTGDFNSDGKTDILWRHKVSGDAAVWLMDGIGIMSGQIFYRGVDLNWQIRN